MAWRDEIGDFVSFEENKWTEVKFLHDEPREIERTFGREKKKGFEWDVKIGGADKLLQTSSYGLLKQLAAVKNLKDKTLRIMRIGEKELTKYKVEAPGTLK